MFTSSQPSERIPEIQRILSSGSEQEKIDVLHNLQELIGSAFADFIGNFAKKWWEERRASERKLEQMIKDEVEKDIESEGVDLTVQNSIGAMLTTSSVGARAHYVRSLGEIGNKKAQEGLLLALGDESDDVRIDAIRALCRTEEGLEVLSSEEGLNALRSA